MSKKGQLIILSGPSGSGTGTVLHELLQADENLRLSISATTRSPREGEEDGKAYYFLDLYKRQRPFDPGVGIGADRTDILIIIGVLLFAGFTVCLREAAAAVIGKWLEFNA